MLGHVCNYLLFCVAVSSTICPYWNNIWKTSEVFFKPQFLHWTNSKVRLWNISTNQHSGAFRHCNSFEAQKEVFCSRAGARLCVRALQPLNICDWEKRRKPFWVTPAVNQTYLDWGCQRFRVLTNITHRFVMVSPQTFSTALLRSSLLLHDITYSILHAVIQRMIWSRWLIVLLPCHQHLPTYKPYLSSYPRYLREPQWFSMELPEISKVTIVVWLISP